MPENKIATSNEVAILLETVARSAGFEPTTPWFVARYSIQLSYERAEKKRDYRGFFGDVNSK